MNVIKRSGEEVAFDASKIENAVRKANAATVQNAEMSDQQIREITERVVKRCQQVTRAVSVEEIQDMVETEIMAEKAYQVAHNYITYRYERALVRKANTTDKQILSLIGRNNETVKQENSNKNPTVNSTQRDYMAGEVSKDITRRFLLPQDIIDAHEKGIIHFHDADYFAQPMYNCCLVNLEDMLENGTVISETTIDKPHSFATACNIATQIIAQVASNQYGGQTITLSHLAPFVEVSRQKHRKTVAEEFREAGIEVDQDKINKVAEERVRKEIRTGVQTIQYQIITLMTTNGQAPFVTVFMYLDEVPAGQTREDLALIIEEMLKQRMQGVKNEKGVYITPAFPKLIYCLDEDNIHENSKYYYLTKLAAQCTAKRMVPDYISAKIMKELKGDVYPCMGCRSFLTPDRFTDAGEGNVANAGSYKPGQHKYYGRFNQGVVTINLVDVACSSKGNMDDFWKIFDERLDLCYRALMIRHNRLLGTPSDVAPILWQYGAIARLKKDNLKMEGFLDEAFKLEYFKDTKPSYNGLQVINRKVIMRLLQKMLEIDSENAPFTILGTEKKISSRLTTSTGKKVGIYGIIDRLDCAADKASGTPVIRVIDYKTGRKSDSTLKSIGEIFEPKNIVGKHTDYYLQTILYAKIVCSNQSLNPSGLPVKPILFYVQNAKAGEGNLGLLINKVPVAVDKDFGDEFTDGIHKVINDIFDESLPFAPTAITTQCDKCPFYNYCY